MKLKNISDGPKQFYSSNKLIILEANEEIEITKARFDKRVFKIQEQKKEQDKIKKEVKR